ncbi:MAG: IclR family transcriptional regulator [Pseudorhizobium sp.]
MGGFLSEMKVQGVASVSGARAVERALGLMAAVGTGGGSGVSLADVVRDTGLNKPTARRLLIALMRSRLVEQDEETRRYHLGPELYVLGLLAAPRHGLLDMAAESLQRLSNLSGDTSFVSMRRGDYAACLHRQEGAHPVKTHALLAGDQNPLGVGAGSLAMLAALADDEASAVLQRVEAQICAQYRGYTSEILRSDILQARECGYALNPGRVIASSWGIGMPILLPNGRLAGALSIAAIDSRMTQPRQSELAVLLSEEVGRIQAKLQRLFKNHASDAETIQHKVSLTADVPA